jgi:hypothetical protein
MSDRKKEMKIVEHLGKKKVATKHEGDLQWVIPHDHQEKLLEEYEQQEKDKNE